MRNLIVGNGKNEQFSSFIVGYRAGAARNKPSFSPFRPQLSRPGTPNRYQAGIGLLKKVDERSPYGTGSDHRNSFIKTHDLSPFYYLRSEEHTSELQSRGHLVCRLL